MARLRIERMSKISLGTMTVQNYPVRGGILRDHINGRTNAKRLYKASGTDLAASEFRMMFHR